MKRYMALLLLLALQPAVFAGEAGLRWDASPSEVDGYAVFDRNFEKPYAYDNPAWIGTADELACRIENLPDDRQTGFVARSWAWGVYDLNGNRVRRWSGDSNEVTYMPEGTDPQPPGNLLLTLFTAVMDFFVKLSTFLG